MTKSLDYYDLDRRAVRFLRALHGGDVATLADLWHEAESHPELEAFLEDLLDEEGVGGEHRAQEAVKCPASLREETPSPSAGRVALPPLPTVVVRHRFGTADENPTRTHPRHRQEPRRDAGLIENAQ